VGNKFNSCDRVTRGGLWPKILRGRDIAEKASHHFKKASTPLKMYLKSLTILEKPQFL
jgi:hypothetical protein